jgi:3-isopropylmalate/(R)-2-methylmalate dehydratase small subunit
MDPIKQIRSRTAVLPYTNIDTDQIIPARFLRTTVRAGLGKHLFSDWRYAADGSLKPDFALNQPSAAGCQILVAGRNFGCGSSREHAPWALHDYGFRAVISTEIADIFRGNSLKNGLLPIVVDAASAEWLLAHPGAELLIDLERNVITLPTGTQVHFEIEGFARYCLLNGIDELGYLRSQEAAITRFETRRQATAAGPAGH